MLDFWWQRMGKLEGWASTLGEDDVEAEATLRRCTYAGRPFGNAGFMERMSQRFSRSWVRGRPNEKSTRRPIETGTDRQMMLIAE